MLKFVPNPLLMPFFYSNLKMFINEKSDNMRTFKKKIIETEVNKKCVQSFYGGALKQVI
jgi:hypothetical protein